MSPSAFTSLVSQEKEGHYILLVTQKRKEKKIIKKMKGKTSAGTKEEQGKVPFLLAPWKERKSA